jgi:uncharacterized membrane protein
MNSKTLIVVLLCAVAVSVISLSFFGWGGNFGGRGYGPGEIIPRSVLLLLIVAPIVVIIVFLAYSMIFPEISEKKTETKPLTPEVKNNESVLDAVSRVLNEDERKVINILVAEGGTMLQKDIRWKTGLTRVKTHRVLLRLAERGIVSAEKHFNTNKIKLADWLMKDKNSGSPL